MSGLFGGGGGAPAPTRSEKGVRIISQQGERTPIPQRANAALQGTIAGGGMRSEDDSWPPRSMLAPTSNGY